MLQKGNMGSAIAPLERSSTVSMDRILAAAEVEFGRRGLDGAKI